MPGNIKYVARLDFLQINKTLKESITNRTQR